MISLFNFITTLLKTNIYPKNWLVWHVFIWWRNKKTICWLFLLAAHDEEQNFMSKMGIILTRSGICQCLCVGMLWFLALVREAEQEWGSTWRTLWLILDKVPKKELSEGGTGAALGFALQKCSSELENSAGLAAAPRRACTCSHQSRALLGSPRLTHLCPLS